MTNEFKAITQLHAWCQKVLPLVYDESLSYYELLCKVLKKLNDLIENNNLLPQYILDLIKEYVNGEEFQKIMADLLSNLFLNVKYPPAGIPAAVGDGTADDTSSIQGCINYAATHNGQSIFIPSGSYLVNSLTLVNQSSLYGNDRYTTRIVLKGGATKPLLSGVLNEVTLQGLQFDGNSDIQVNNVNLIDITVGSAIITNCLLTDGDILLNITVNDNLQINNVLFRRAVLNGMVTAGNGYVQANNLIFESVSSLDGKNFLTLANNKSIFEEIKCLGAVPVAIAITGSNNVVRFWNDKGVTSYTDTGINNTVEVYTASESKKFSGDVTVRATNETTTVDGDYTVTAGDIAETATGNFTADVGIDYDLTVKGDRNINVTGNDTTKVTGNSSLNAHNETENVTETKTVNAKDIVLNPTNPLTYKTPQDINQFFSFVPFKDNTGKVYDVLVDKDVANIGVIVDGESAPITIDTSLTYDKVAPANTQFNYGFNLVADRAKRKAANTIRVAACNSPDRYMLKESTNGGVPMYGKLQDTNNSFLMTGADVICGNEWSWNRLFPLKALYSSPYYPYIGAYSALKLDTRYPANFTSDNLYLMGGYNHYGNGIASCYPLLDTGGANVGPYPPTIPREGYGYFHANINLNGKIISFYSIHWDYLGGSTQNVIEFANIVNTDTAAYIVVGGDWNLDYLVDANRYDPLVNIGFTVTNTNILTNPEGQILDNILIKGNITVGEKNVITPINMGDQLQGNNDHYYYYADLTFN